MLLVEKVDSYSAFTAAVNEAVSEKLYDKMVQEGFIEELGKMHQIKESFAAINEKCMCSKDDDSDDDDDKDDDDDNDSADDDDSGDDNDSDDDNDD